jgi:hypothetical protein
MSFVINIVRFHRLRFEISRGEVPLFECAIVLYSRAVFASTRAAPAPSDAETQRERAESRHHCHDIVTEFLGAPLEQLNDNWNRGVPLRRASPAA